MVLLSLFWGLLSLFLILWVCSPAWLQRHFAPFSACSSANSEHAVDSVALQRLRVDSLLRAPRKVQALIAAHSKKTPNAISHIDGYEETFSDLNPQHLNTARKVGIPSWLSCRGTNARFLRGALRRAARDRGCCG